MRRNSTVAGSRPDLFGTSDVFGQDFVSNMDKSSPYFLSPLSSLRLEALRVEKAR